MSKIGGRKFIYCNEWDGDSNISIKNLEKLLLSLKKKYGANAHIAFDAGHNNVQVMIQPSKSQEEK